MRVEGGGRVAWYVINNCRPVHMANLRKSAYKPQFI